MKANFCLELHLRTEQTKFSGKKLGSWLMHLIFFSLFLPREQKNPSDGGKNYFAECDCVLVQLWKGKRKVGGVPGGLVAHFWRIAEKSLGTEEGRFSFAIILRRLKLSFLFFFQAFFL